MNHRIKFTYISLFPELIRHYLSDALIEKARMQGLLSFDFIPLRDYALGKYKSVDDAPFGGGDGAIFQVAPLQACLEDVRLKNTTALKTRVIYLSPQGRPCTQGVIQELSSYEHLILISGRYGGVDQRFISTCVDEEISIGDFILSGGELPSLVLTEAISRLIPGVLGDVNSAEYDTFTNGLLEAPQFTRPQDFKGMRVPEVLTGGNHQKIQEWKDQISVLVTLKKRPDLLENKTNINWAEVSCFYNEISSEERALLQIENLEDLILKRLPRKAFL